MTGQRFGRLVVQGYAGRQRRYHYWQCLCDCGQCVDVLRSNLVQAITRSCGCLHSEIAGGIVIHGEAKKTPEYIAWCSMRGRCLNPNNHAYKDYGGRGIGVCDRWLESFENFLTDMGRKPSPLHSLDRYPDNNGDYGPGNCRWATKREQARNRRKPTQTNPNAKAA